MWNIGEIPDNYDAKYLRHIMRNYKSFQNPNIPRDYLKKAIEELDWLAAKKGRDARKIVETVSVNSSVIREDAHIKASLFPADYNPAAIGVVYEKPACHVLLEVDLPY
jgi:integrase